jgi:acyl-CoA ligase (AMP-forming) (exosortase A-associated)
MKHEATLLHELPALAAHRSPAAFALHEDASSVRYDELVEEIQHFASTLARLRIGRGERVAIYLDKRREAVVASFGAPAHGAVFVPINPLLKAEQVAYVLRDCGVAVLVTSGERLRALGAVLADCPALAHVIVVSSPSTPAGASGSPSLHPWSEVLDAAPRAGHRVIDTDTVAILYTSGSTGKPKGVVLSHRNMVAGAKSVASYLDNRHNDVLLAALPLSFDAGFSQLTTAFHAGASVVLLNYLLPKDIVRAVAERRVTGITAVPPLWIQLTQVTWAADVSTHLRYFANTGGRMPRQVLDKLRMLWPQARPYLMYGLTEAFRATYLPPEEVDQRPDSIGKAIPNSEVLVLRPDGTPCDAGEPGELVQRGALVAQGYWNDPATTAERFRPLPHREGGVVLPEIAVFSGDTVRTDDEGFLYFVGRRDEMIKSSGYRISPNEVEEVVYATGMVTECAAIGIPHEALGEAVVVVATPSDSGVLDVSGIHAACRSQLPAYMVPSKIEVREGSLPRNANGKIDRKSIAAELRGELEVLPK